MFDYTHVNFNQRLGNFIKFLESDYLNEQNATQCEIFSMPTEAVDQIGC
jgi:hypothetical protein